MSQPDPNTETDKSASPSPIRRALPRTVQMTILFTVFVSGGILGAVVATKVTQSKMETYRNNSPVFAIDVSARLSSRLKLTDEQTGKVSEILERRHTRIIDFREQGSEAMHAEFDAMVDEIAMVLDEQQLSHWHSISESVRRRFLPPTSGQIGLEGFEPGGIGGKPTIKIFKAFDINQGGNLNENEVPPRMWYRLSALDSNKDGKVTRDEFGEQ